MLDTMRALSKSIVSKLLLGLLVVSFGVWGVGDILRNGNVNEAVNVGNSSISMAEFSGAYKRLKEQLDSAGMKNLPPGTIEKSVLQQLVQQRLGQLALRDAGLYVSDTIAAERIAAMKEFQDKKTGKFNAETYRAILRRSGLSEAALVTDIKKEAATQFLGDTLNMQGITAPESVRTLDAITAAETRDAVIFTIPANAKTLQEDEEAMRSYYESNKATHYLEPESRSFDYITLNKPVLEHYVEQSVTKEMIAERRASNPELKDELIRMKLLSEQREKALHELGNRLEDELASGKTLAQATEAIGLNVTPQTLSNITQMSAAMTPSPLLKTVTEKGFAMGEGEISGLIPLPGGESIVLAVKSVTPAAPRPYEAVRADIRKRLADTMARDAAHEKATAIKNKIGQTPSWQAVASEEAVATRIISRLPRPEDGKTSPIPAPLHRAIFERKEGEVAGPLALDNGDQVLALVTKSYLPKPESIKLAADKPGAPSASDRLARDIENRAYLSFNEKHPVTVNKAAIQSVVAPASGE